MAGVGQCWVVQLSWRAATERGAVQCSSDEGGMRMQPAELAGRLEAQTGTAGEQRASDETRRGETRRVEGRKREARRVAESETGGCCSRLEVEVQSRYGGMKRGVNVERDAVILRRLQ